LEDLAEKIGWFGLFSGVALFLVLLVWLIFSEIIPTGFNSSKHIGDILSYLMLAVTLIVVAVPEGLPLAVTLSLAFSVKQMLEEKNLVKRLACCETMGSAHVICTDKTGTLTQNDMNIVEVWNGVSHQSNLTTAPFAFTDQLFADEYKDLVFTSICTNSTSVLKPNPKGSATEIALLKYADKFYSNKDLFAERCHSE
jgi:P-type E1-E2 ATPase